MRYFAMLLLAVPVVGVAPLPLLTVSAEAQSASQICMARMTTGREGGEREVNIIVKQVDEEAFEARGFAQVACRSTDEKRSKFKQEICKFAKITPPAVQADFRNQYGATPDELCDAVK